MEACTLQLVKTTRPSKSLGTTIVRDQEPVCQMTAMKKIKMLFEKLPGAEE